jgi:hypothetical protein
MPLADAAGLCLPPALHRPLYCAQRIIPGCAQVAHATVVTRYPAMLQGSGWGWLGYNKANGALEVATCANQDPLSTKVGSTWGERCARKAVQCRHGGV